MAEISGVNAEGLAHPVKVPKPVGYKILIAIPKKENSIKVGDGSHAIHLPDDHVEREEVASVVGLVVAMGDLCYKGITASGEPRFPTGPWCKDGDFVLIRAYTGMRFKVVLDGVVQEFRMINDDNVEAVVDDPRYIKRA